MMTATIGESVGEVFHQPPRVLHAVLLTSDRAWTKKAHSIQKLERRGVHVTKILDPSRLLVESLQGADVVISISGHVQYYDRAKPEIERIAGNAGVPHWFLPSETSHAIWQQLDAYVAAHGHAVAPPPRVSEPDSSPYDVEATDDATPAPAKVPPPPPTSDDDEIRALYEADAETAKTQARVAAAERDKLVAQLAEKERELETARTTMKANLDEVRRMRDEAAARAKDAMRRLSEAEEDAKAKGAAASWAHEQRKVAIDKATEAERRAMDAETKLVAVMNGKGMATTTALPPPPNDDVREVLAVVRGLAMRLASVDTMTAQTLGALDALTREVATMRGMVGVHLAIANVQPVPPTPSPKPPPPPPEPAPPPPVPAPPVASAETPRVFIHDEPAAARIDTAAAVRAVEALREAKLTAAAAAPDPLQQYREAQAEDAARYEKRVEAIRADARLAKHAGGRPESDTHARAVAVVAKKPGATARDVATALKIADKYAAGVLLGLVKKGKLVYARTGKPFAYALPDAKAAAAPPKPAAPPRAAAAPTVKKWEPLILDYMKKHPGSTGVDINAALGMREGHIYDFIRPLEKHGVIRCEGSGMRHDPRRWFVK